MISTKLSVFTKIVITILVAVIVSISVIKVNKAKAQLSVSDYQTEESSK